MRLIDADALCLDINRKAHENFPANRNLTLYAESLLAHAPTIDAVPVVRCKDCEYRRPTVDEITHEVVGHWCDLLDLRNVEDGDFCCWGDRKRGDG